MTGIVLFIIIHVSLALLVPQTLVAMFTGGPVISDRDQPASGQLEPTRWEDAMKPPSKSMFQPRQGVAQDFLDENRKLIAQIDRRNVLRDSLTLGGLTLLGGCAVPENAQLRPCTMSAVTENAQLQIVLRAVSDWNNRVQAFIFRPDHLAPTYSEAQVVKPPRFNAHFDADPIITKRGIGASQGCTIVRSGTREYAVVQRRTGALATSTDVLR